jgi:CheY-like chemotaxis protein
VRRGMTGAPPFPHIKKYPSQPITLSWSATHGIELTVAHDAREGIAAFQSGFFNLVLMDLNMPEIGGFEAIGEIRRWESEQKLAPTPIAALTALTDFDTAAHSLALGCVLHLAKPITRQTLLQIVNQYSAPPRLMASRFRF